MGIVFATPANQLSASKLTVREELAFGLENLGVPRTEMDVRIDSTLERLGIAHLADREPFALSGGEQQRVAIASIVAMGTSLLVLDEPTAQLDPAGTETVADLLEELARAGRRSCASSTTRPSSVRWTDASSWTADPPSRWTTPGSRSRRRTIGSADAADARPPRAGGLDRPWASLRRGRDRGGIAGQGESRRWDGSAPRHAGPRRTAVGGHAAWSPGDDRAPVRIAVEGLVHRYPSGIEAVSGVSLAIEPGEAVAILGQNGSGKTTLVKHLNGLLRPAEGRVLLDGTPTDRQSVAELARTVGFVFQNPDDQLFERSVEREVAFGPRNLRPVGCEAREPGRIEPGGGRAGRPARDQPL